MDKYHQYDVRTVEGIVSNIVRISQSMSFDAIHWQEDNSATIVNFREQLGRAYDSAKSSDISMAFRALFLADLTDTREAIYHPILPFIAKHPEFVFAFDDDEGAIRQRAEEFLTLSTQTGEIHHGGREIAIQFLGLETE